MLGAGISQLVQSNPGVAAIATAGGGFANNVPKDFTLPTWRYTLVGGEVSHTLAGERGPRNQRMQIDCYGNTAGEAQQLSNAIDAVLDGFVGNLSDPETTNVLSCLSGNEPSDFYDDDRRCPGIMLEYEIWFN